MLSNYVADKYIAGVRGKWQSEKKKERKAWH